MTGNEQERIVVDGTHDIPETCQNTEESPAHSVTTLRDHQETINDSVNPLPSQISLTGHENKLSSLTLSDRKEKRKVRVLRENVANKVQKLVSMQWSSDSDLDEWTYLRSVYDTDEDGDSLLHTAIILGQDELAVQLVNICPAVYLVSCPNKLAQTPLHLATITNQPSVVRRLVVAGANIEARDKFGNTPLHLACQQGLVDVISCLTEPVKYHETQMNVYDLPYQRIPQNLELKNYDGMTCLHLAAHARHHDVLKNLIYNGADVNGIENKTGRTVLHIACLAGNLKLVKLLLAYNRCDINAHAYDDLTPFDLARSRGHSDVVMELAVAGVRYNEEI